MPRVAMLLLALVALVALAGCGNSKTQSSRRDVGVRGGPTMGPYLFDLRGAVKELRAEGIDVHRTGPSHLADRALPAPEKSADFTADGTPFTLLLFPSGDLANDAANSLSSHVDGDVVIGQNILAVVRRRGRGFDRVRAAIAGLGSNPPGPEPGQPAPGEPYS